MISIRQNFLPPRPANVVPLSLSREIEDPKVCPHCGKSIEHNPDDTFDTIERKILVRSRRVEDVVWARSVPPQAWEVLMFLLRHIGQYRSTERVHQACFNEDVDLGSVTVTIGILRKALSGTPYTIETRWGFGYRLLRVGIEKSAE